jgi:lipoprotein-anchoring transpeptidase ErfK/SrfK
VAVALAVGLGAAAYFSLVRGSAGSAPAPSPSVDIHSKEAVMAAVRHYYQVEDKAGETGDMHLIVAVTTGPGTPAYENLKEYFREQAAKNRNSIITKDDISDWSVVITDSTAVIRYGIVQHGHDIDATTRQAVEADTKTTKGIYKATMKLKGQVWLMHERQLINDAAT